MWTYVVSTSPWARHWIHAVWLRIGLQGATTRLISVLYDVRLQEAPDTFWNFKNKKPTRFVSTIVQWRRRLGAKSRCCILTDRTGSRQRLNAVGHRCLSSVTLSLTYTRLSHLAHGIEWTRMAVLAMIGLRQQTCGPFFALRSEEAR